MPSLAALRDLPLRVHLDDKLEAEVNDFVRQPTPAGGTPEAQAYFEHAHKLTERCLEFLDAETARLTQQVFTIGDPSALRQRVVGDPRRQVDTALAAFKTKLQAEKQEWTRRFTKQTLDVQDGLEKHYDSLKAKTHVEKDAVVISLEEMWTRSFIRWFDDVLAQWAGHVGSLLQDKTGSAVEDELKTVGRLLGQPIKFRAPAAAHIQVPLVGELQGLKERGEVPTSAESFLESLKGGLNTVAMIAGLIIVPVVGNFTTETPTHIRAGIMASCCAPILFFAFFEMRRQRKKLVERNEEKASQVLRKDLADMCKGRLERFRMELDKTVQSYLAAFQEAAMDQVEPIADGVFKQKEAQLATELTQLKLQTDRFQDQLGAIRQVKTSLSQQLLVDVKRKLKELASAPAGP